MLVVEGLTKAFGDMHAVREVSLTVPAGQFVGVIGRSGAGKSTFLRMLNRLAEPTSGRILWHDTDVTGMSGRNLRIWRRRCAMIFQQFNLVGRLDVLNNVLLGRLAYTPFWRAALKAWPSEDRAMALAALDQFDMAELAPRRADHLSGGQQQRVAICRALLQEPEIVLADEPVASLDPRNAHIVMDALLRINRHFGLTVLCNLHSLDLARSYCDRLVGMAAGRVVFDDVPAALTDAAARELYGIEAAEVIGAAPAAASAGATSAAASAGAMQAAASAGATRAAASADATRAAASADATRAAASADATRAAISADAARAPAHA
jgi:phosphonate transport system ATP-binding protein